MRELTLTVSELNEYVRRSLAGDPILHGVTLRGELSNFKRHVSGHWYFTLKDENAAINCAMFRQSAMTVDFRPENGQQVRLVGSVGLYVKTGSYQFYADSMQREGVGDLYMRFEALKRRLGSEGLFDPSLKKPIPLLPRGVGVVTSKTGAVVHDIARVSWRRFAGMPIYLCPVKVQGEGAAEEIAQGLRTLDHTPGVDVIIVGRGGGSMEDLWAFNEEAVARAIAACNKPVVSAVGHETDFTIADFVADLRAATPSAAAELVVPQKESLQQGLEAFCDRLEDAVQRRLSARRLRLSSVQKTLESLSPVRRSERMHAALEALFSRMEHAAQSRLSAGRSALEKADARFENQLSAALIQRKNRLERAQLRLHASGPMETMKRGYAIVSRNGALVRNAAALNPGDRLTVRMADGSVQTMVESVQQEE